MKKRFYAINSAPPDADGTAGNSDEAIHSCFGSREK